MNNTSTSIAFSIFSNKGIYALILGSGVSKNSGIPTGWDIVVDLIKKLAKLKKEDCSPNPEEWFKLKYSEEPNYSNILSRIVKTPSERVNFLKHYFEPTVEEAEHGLKMPTIAHKAIAQLVKNGYLKVIITTNFDRLLEKALYEIGIEPVIIRHPDDIDGALPIVHSDFVLIKIHGDYLDSRFLNTKEELTFYNPKLHDYLLRIINEFGILSCGWSAKWDKGFVNILRQCENYRFFSYWTYLGNCEDELKDISNFRKGETVNILNADNFFTEISEKIGALESLDNNHPLNSGIAVARLKKYIVSNDNKILLHDLIISQQEKIFTNLRGKIINDLYPDSKNLLTYLSFSQKTIEPLMPIIINGVFWSKPEHHYLFTNLLSRFSEPSLESDGIHYDLTKRFYYFPSLFLFYAIGISAIKCKNYKLLYDCFHLKIFESKSEFSNEFVMIKRIHSLLVDSRDMNRILGKNYHTPVSEYAYTYLRPYFENFILSDREFMDTFDIFEYLLALNYISIIDEQYESIFAPVGRFKWRRGKFRTRAYLLNDLLSEAEKMQSNWDLLKSGMFEGRYEIYASCKSKLEEFLKGINFM